MKRGGAAAVVVVALGATLLVAREAWPIITMDLVVMAGIELDEAAAEALPEEKLRAAGFELIWTPSMTWDDDARPTRAYVGTVLARHAVTRSKRDGTTLPLPPPKLAKEVAAKLKKLGVAPDPAVRLIVVLQYGGGK